MRLRPVILFFPILLVVLFLSNKLSAQTSASGGLTGVVTSTRIVQLKLPVVRRPRVLARATSAVKPDAVEKVLIADVGTQRIEAGIHFQKRRQPVMVVRGFLQPREGFVFFAERDVDQPDMVR